MTRYVTLVASLPALPDFERAKRLPINRERLEGRLKMLTPEDYREAVRAEAFLTWQRQPEHRTDDELLSAYEEILRSTRSPVLREMLEGRRRRRALQAALRRRHRGEPPPEPNERWASADLMYVLRRNWARPDFGLGRTEPWVDPMVELLRAGDAVGLERLLMRGSWNALSALMARERPRFGFGAVLVYLFQWDILSRWIAYEPERARARFDALIEESWRGIEWN
jgi:hypothetical protein